MGIKELDGLITNWGLLVIGEYIGIGVIVALTISIYAAYRLRSKLLHVNHKYQQVAKVATFLSAAFGIWIFAGLLVIQAVFAHDRSSLEERTLQANKQKLEQEKASPKYLEGKIRGWLDRAGYASKSVEPVGNQSFYIVANGTDGMIFMIAQNKNTPGIVSANIAMRIKDSLATQVDKLSDGSKRGLHQEIETELLRLGIPHGISIGKNNEIHLGEEFPVDADGMGVEFMNKLFALKRAKRLVEIHTDKTMNRMAAKK